MHISGVVQRQLRETGYHLGWGSHSGGWRVRGGQGRLKVDEQLLQPSSPDLGGCVMPKLEL